MAYWSVGYARVVYLPMLYACASSRILLYLLRPLRGLLKFEFTESVSICGSWYKFRTLILAN